MRMWEACPDRRSAAAQYAEAGDRSGQAYALTHLGLVRQQGGDYPAAAPAAGMRWRWPAARATGSPKP
jgi:hypothetical protein